MATYKIYAIIVPHLSCEGLGIHYSPIITLHADTQSKQPPTSINIKLKANMQGLGYNKQQFSVSAPKSGHQAYST